MNSFIILIFTALPSLQHSPQRLCRLPFLRCRPTWSRFLPHLMNLCRLPFLLHRWFPVHLSYFLFLRFLRLRFLRLLHSRLQL